MKSNQQEIVKLTIVRAGNKDWAYPILDWKIILRFKQKDRFWEDDFSTISHFSHYLKGSPHKANQIGYGVPDDKRTNFEPVSEVSLHFWYTDVFGKSEDLEFVTVQEFAKYLDEHPRLAHCVSYVRKNRI